MMRSGLVNMIR